MYISFFHVHYKTIVSVLMKFTQKMFRFNFLHFTVEYFNLYKKNCNFKKTSCNYKTFISRFFILLKLTNCTFNKTQCVISLYKLFIYQKVFFVSLMIFFLSNEDQHWLYSVYCVLKYWWPMGKVILCFSNKRWSYKHHWCPKNY